MYFFKQNILVFSRQNITNYGDPIIADCCQYIIQKTAKENHIRVNVTIEDIYEKNLEVTREKLKNVKKVVFPGGGMNSVVFNNLILQIFEMIEPMKKVSVYFNAIGILKVNPNPKNEELLIKIFNKPFVKQVSTRGDLPKLQTYIKTPRKYSSELILDPAIWVNEAYRIERNPKSKTIGIGVIRPEIFTNNGNDFSVDDVLNMYVGIIQELEKRGYKWKLFSNGMHEDYKFGAKILKHLGLEKKKYLVPNSTDCRDLVTKISKFQAVIAARLHANIIATSLSIPSVGLVWNDKMNLFADIIGCPERYLSVEYLLDGEHIVDVMETAIEEGYNTAKINAEKKKTVKTIKNILK